MSSKNSEYSEDDHESENNYPFKPPRTHQPGPGIEMEFNLMQCHFNGRDSIKAVEAVMTGVRREMYEYY